MLNVRVGRERVAVLGFLGPVSPSPPGLPLLVGCAADSKATAFGETVANARVVGAAFLLMGL